MPHFSLVVIGSGSGNIVASAVRAGGSEISGRFTALASDRWDVRLSAEVTGARQRGDQIEVDVSAGSPVTGELMLVAAGRTPDTADLDLDQAGARLREDGRIEVDEYGRTTAEGIWSLEVVENALLKLQLDHPGHLAG